MIRGGCKALARAGLAALVIVGTMGAAQAQGEPATIKRATELRAGPGESAKVLAPLAAQTQVQRLTERQGPWVKVLPLGLGRQRRKHLGAAPDRAPGPVGQGRHRQR